MSTQRTGACACGAIRFTCEDASAQAVHCFCRDCQRATGGAFATVLFLFASWSVLSVFYALPVRVLAWLAGRVASLGKSWRVASAALLPGAAWMGGAMLLYALEHLSLIGLGVAFGLHFVVGWVYVIGAPFCLARQAEGALTIGGNPFTPVPAAEMSLAPAPVSPASPNPFQNPPAPPADNG